MHWSIVCLTLFFTSSATTSSKIQFKSENVNTGNSRGETLRPIVLVPGILGSVLEAKLNKSTARHWVCYSRSDWFKIWLTSEVLVPLEGDCWVDNLKLDYRPIGEGGVTNTTGVEIRAPHFGTPRGSVDYLDPGDSKWSSLGNYFGYIADTFVSTYGYTEGHNLVAAPYDWRYAPNSNQNHYCHQLQDLITATVAKSSGKGATVACHSMGNLFFFYCAKHVWPASWKASHIHGFVSIAAPFGGAPKALKMITSGENWGIPILRPNQLRVAERSWASAYFLLPNPFLTPKKYSSDLPMMRVDDYRNFTEYQYNDFFKSVAKTDSDFEFSNGMYTAYSGEQLLGSMQALGIRTTCLFGVGVTTTNRLRWYKHSRFPDYTPYEETVMGDGTVPEWSSGDVCKKWRNEQNERIEIAPLPNTDHVGTLWHSDTLSAIARMTGLDSERIKRVGLVERELWTPDKL